MARKKKLTPVVLARRVLFFILGSLLTGILAVLIEVGLREFLPRHFSVSIAVGAAVVTTAGKLFAKQVIHAPTMEQPGMKVGVENVRRATRAALLAAARLGIEVLAIPGMGTGLGGVDPADAARAMVDELRAHRQPKPATVYLVDIDDEILLCLEEALRLAVG